MFAAAECLFNRREQLRLTLSGFHGQQNAACGCIRQDIAAIHFIIDNHTRYFLCAQLCDDLVYRLRMQFPVWIGHIHDMQQQIPNSGIRIGYSTKFIDLGSILDAAKPYSVESLPPDLLAAQTLRDYLAGKDTAVEAILSRTRDTAPAKLVLTRGALAAALGRAYAAETGETLNLEQPTFSDVSMFSYLAPYVVWAQKNGILYGETASCFAPDRAVTRQELAAVLSRYAAFRGRPFPAAGTCSPTDAASIAPWAVDAARSLAEAGVLPLKNGAFQPRGTVARADWAGIFARLP